MEVELIVDAKAAVGESAVWQVSSQLLFWVDIREGHVHVHDPGGQPDRVISIGQMLGAVVPKRHGGLMLAMHHGFAHLNLATQQLSPVADPEHHLPQNRFNDGKCDPAGRFWAGTMCIDGRPNAGNVYCLDTNHTVRHVFGGVTCSNGIVWSLDRSTMYYIDTPTRRVDAFDYEKPSGCIANRRTVIVVPEEMGMPDGMAIDAEGKLWIALWNGGCVSRWDPRTGVLDRVIRIPAPNVTSCAFGGPNVDDLYITTARFGMTRAELAAQPHAGGLFRVHGAAQGIETFEFLGEGIPPLRSRCASNVFCGVR